MRKAIAGVGVLMLIGCGSKSSESEKAEKPEKAPVATEKQPAAKPEPEKKQGKPKAYVTALREGRALVKNKDYAGAIAKLDAALAVVEGDATALSEIGWAALQAGDLERAQDATTRSIAAAENPKLKAASLYNLGRIAEERGDKDAAKQAYTESLALRPNDTVEKRLAKLENREVRDLLTPQPIGAAYARFEDVCVEPDPAPAETPACPIKVGHTLEAPAAPFEAVRTLRLLSEPDEEVWESTDCELAIQTRGKWYFSAPVECEVGPGFTAVTKIELVAQDGGAPVLRVDYHTNLSSRFADYNEELAVFCGVGKSGAPTCTRAILTREFGVDYIWSDAEGTEIDEQEYESKSDVAMGADGVLTVGTQKRKLVFP